MAKVTIKPVRSWIDRRKFLYLPKSVYRGDPNWVPPLWGHQRQLAGFRRHPFYDSARAQAFLAERDGQVCGRIAAIVNDRHNQTFHETRGFFGFFESIDDADTAAALVEAAHTWVREHGMGPLRGPVSPSMNYECGLLVDGFDSSPTFMMTYNPPYYAELLEQCGFVKAHDLLAYIGHREQLPQVEAEVRGLADQAQARCQATIRPLNTARFHQDVQSFLELYNRSCVAMWGFVPLSQGEVRQVAAELKHLLVPELSLFAEVDGQQVGVVLGVPDYNPAIRAIGGRLFPFGVFKLLAARRQVRRIRVWSIAVVPEYQRWGLGLVLMRSLVPKALEIGVQEAEFSWVSETNTLARLGLEKGGARLYKTYRIYDRAG